MTPSPYPPRSEPPKTYGQRVHVQIEGLLDVDVVMRLIEECKFRFNGNDSLLVEVEVVMFYKRTTVTVNRSIVGKKTKISVASELTENVIEDFHFMKTDGEADVGHRIHDEFVSVIWRRFFDQTVLASLSHL